jgi:hypothetical protein
MLRPYSAIGTPRSGLALVLPAQENSIFHLIFSNPLVYWLTGKLASLQ